MPLQTCTVQVTHGVHVTGQILYNTNECRSVTTDYHDTEGFGNSHFNDDYSNNDAMPASGCQPRLPPPKKVLFFYILYYILTNSSTPLAIQCQCNDDNAGRVICPPKKVVTFYYFSFIVEVSHSFSKPN